MDKVNQSVGKRIADKLLTVWNVLNTVPNCPACKGTGESQAKYQAWAEPVYWKGEIVWVCHNCKGTGRV